MAPAPKVAPEALPAGAKVAALEIAPPVVILDGAFASAQILVTARLADGTRLDATRLAKLSLNSAAADITPAGQLSARANGRSTVTATLGGQSARAAVTVAHVVEA